MKARMEYSYPGCFRVRSAAAARLFAVLLLSTGCGPSDDDAGGTGEAAAARPAAAIKAAPPLTTAELENARYHDIAEQPVSLQDGEWRGAPYVEGGAAAPGIGLAEDFRLDGELDGDAAPESVVLLWSSSGGSGTFDYLAVIERGTEGSPVNRATAPLGDRVQIRSAAIEDGAIVLETLESGPEDAACCPGQKLRRHFRLQDDALVEYPAEDRGRISLADLSGPTWRLKRFAKEEAVPVGIDITLSFDGEIIAGSAGCNRYSGRVSTKESPLELALAAPLAVTRMACPPPAGPYEARYLQALQNLDRYSFLAGDLLLSWRSGDRLGVLRFEQSPGDSPP